MKVISHGGQRTELDLKKQHPVIPRMLWTGRRGQGEPLLIFPSECGGRDAGIVRYWTAAKGHQVGDLGWLLSTTARLAEPRTKALLEDYMSLYQQYYLKEGKTLLVIEKDNKALTAVREALAAENQKENDHA